MRIDLITATGWVILSFLAALELILIIRIWTNRINLNRLISDPTGDASMARFQLLIFTFVIAVSLFLVVAGQSPPALPTDIPNGLLVLLGISGSTYVVSKGDPIQQ